MLNNRITITVNKNTISDEFDTLGLSGQSFVYRLPTHKNTACAFMKMWLDNKYDFEAKTDRVEEGAFYE
jgi:hypothetical protein